MGTHSQKEAGPLQKVREGSLIGGRRFGSLIAVGSHALRRCGDLGRSRIVGSDASKARAVTETSEGKALEVQQGRQHPAWTLNEKPPEAGDCGVNRIVHRPHRGKLREAGQSVAARSTGCSSLICRIAIVGRTYLWPWLLGAERHESRPWHSYTRTEATLTGGRGSSVEQTGTQRSSLRVDNRVKASTYQETPGELRVRR
jgi:hypothetical protein